MAMLILPDPGSPIWRITTTLLGAILSAAFILDAGWMVAILRGRPAPAVGPPIKENGRWREAGYEVLTILGIAPVMMEMSTGTGSALSDRAMALPVLAIALLGATIAAKTLNHPRMVRLLTVLAMLAMVAAYALSDRAGVTHYIALAGLTLLIVGLLFAAASLRGLLLKVRPRTRPGVAARLALDAGLATAILILACGQWFRS